MPVLGGGGSGTFGGCNGITITAQSVVNSVATDLLQRIAPEDPNLLDYVNRVQLQLLRASRWKFLLSPPQRFVTRNEVTDYWIGAAGSGPTNAVETNLNITNLGPIKTDTVFDRSNYRSLKRVLDAPLLSRFMFRDASARKGPPRLWKVSQDQGCTMQLWPAPDNQNGYQPVPEAPLLSTVVGGSLPGRIYFVRVSYVDSLGNESAASDEARLFVPANSLIVVNPPIEIPVAASGIAYDRWNVYIFNAGSSLTTTTGNETKANQLGALAVSSTYTEPSTGFLTSGVSFPTASTIEALGGYLIEFRYFSSKPQVTSLGQVLLIPGDYFDLIVAGVNYFAAALLKDTDASQYWKAEYDAGITGMIRDKNLFPRAPDYISPDSASQTLGSFWGIETDPDFYQNNPGSF